MPISRSASEKVDLRAKAAELLSISQDRLFFFPREVHPNTGRVIPATLRVWMGELPEKEIQATLSRKEAARKLCSGEGVKLHLSEVHPTEANDREQNRRRTRSRKSKLRRIERRKQQS